MPYSAWFLGALAAYALGSLPWAVWLGRWQKGLDLRDYGSGNAGATNSFRVLGPRLGSAVLLLDLGKGWLAVQIAHLVSDNPPLEAALLLGSLSVLGHLYPLFAQFRGGKGVASLLGVMLALQPSAALLALGVFLVLFLSTRVVSLSSISAAFSIPLSLAYLFGESPKVLIIYTFVLALVLLYTHRSNLRRLWLGEERRISLPKRR